MHYFLLAFGPNHHSMIGSSSPLILEFQICMLSYCIFGSAQILWATALRRLLRGIQRRRFRWLRHFEHALTRAPKRSAVMVDRSIPHFHNDLGVPSIKVGVTEFMCTGARPPFDHPHIFIDMGSDIEAICSYCSNSLRLRQQSQRALLASRVRIARSRLKLAAARDHRRCRNRRTYCSNSAVTCGVHGRHIRESELAR